MQPAFRAFLDFSRNTFWVFSLTGKVRSRAFSSGSSFSKGKCQNRCEFPEKLSQFSDAKLTQHTILRSLNIVSIWLLVP
jgi:hypothetical protein